MNYLIENSINHPASLNSQDQNPDLIVFEKLFQRDLRPNTLKALKSDIQHFLKWYVALNKEVFSFGRLVESDIIGYKRACHEQLKHSVRTINRRLINIKSMCKVAVEEGRLKTNVAGKIKLLALQPLAPKSLQPSELRRFMKEVELRGSIRDRLIVEMFAGAGFRVSELANLTLQDVSISERKGVAIVHHSKGKTRQVPLNKKIRELMELYLEKYKPTDKVFLGQRGALTTIAFNKIIDSYARKAQVQCSPHSFRHNFCFNYLSQTNDLVGLSQLVGHSSLDTTKIYTLNRLEDLAERVETMVY